MDSSQHKKSLLVLEDAIVHFLVLGQFGIVAELCELLLECDEIASNSNEVVINSGSNREIGSQLSPETLS